MRGFERDDLAPKDADGASIGGDGFVQFNFELVFPLLKDVGIHGVVFFDAGKIYKERDDIEFNPADLRKSAGGGIRLSSIPIIVHGHRHCRAPDEPHGAAHSPAPPHRHTPSRSISIWKILRADHALTRRCAESPATTADAHPTPRGDTYVSRAHRHGALPTCSVEPPAVVWGELSVAV